MGVRKNPILDMSTETGRMLLKDLRNYKETGYNPWDKKTVGTKKHWESRAEFGEVAYASFKLQSLKLAEIVRAQTPQADKPKIMKNKNKEKTAADDEIELSFRELSIATTIAKTKSARDPINEPYPMGDRIFLLFELDGDVDDESANQFEVLDNGTKVCRWSRVPAARLEAIKLIGGVGLATASEFSFMDADCMILDAAIKKRMKKYKQDEDGEYWELRDEEDLAFPCRPFFYNKLGQPVESYIIDRNNHGYTWGYFWLVGRHVGQMTTKSRRMGGKKCVAPSSTAPGNSAPRTSMPSPAPPNVPGDDEYTELTYEDDVEEVYNDDKHRGGRTKRGRL
jgi:hypothetical protein